MAKSIQLKLSRIHYRGDAIGRDVGLEIEAFGKIFKIEKRIAKGETKEINQDIQEIFDIETENNLLPAEISITVIEKDLLFNDVGSIKKEVKIDTTTAKPQQFSFRVEVKENRSLLSKIFRHGKKAIFEAELIAEVTEGSLGNKAGKIALYADIDPEIKSANLRKEPNEKSDILNNVPNQTGISILKTSIQGTRPQGYLSNLWHEVFYNGKRGFVHSALKRRRGKNILKYLTTLIFILLIGLTAWSWAISNRHPQKTNWRCAPRAEQTNKGIILYNQKCEKAYFFTPENFLADKSNLNLSETETTGMSLYTAGEPLESQDGVLYFLVTASGFCGSRLCNYSLYGYDQKTSKINAVNAQIAGLTKLILSPEEKFLAAASVYGGACDPASSVKVVNLKNNENILIKLEDEELPSNIVENVRWLSNKKIWFTITYTGGCAMDITTIRKKEFIYNTFDGTLTSHFISEEKIARDGAG